MRYFLLGLWLIFVCDDYIEDCESDCRFIGRRVPHMCILTVT